MIKHIGRHGDKKVVILFKTVPDEEHMCLVTYSDALPRLYHDSVMQLLESSAGQSSSEFADVLHRNLLPDGRNVLSTLHREGLIKKVATSAIILTPTNDHKNQVRLDEINKILKEMSQGQEAVRRLAEIDAQSGMRDPKKSSQLAQQFTNKPLDDVTLAQNLRKQADQMQQDANRLLAEAQNLLQQAETLSPPVTLDQPKKKSRKSVKAVV